jgi:hypothetical protein
LRRFVANRPGLELLAPFISDPFARLGFLRFVPPVRTFQVDAFPTRRQGRKQSRSQVDRGTKKKRQTRRRESERQAHSGKEKIRPGRRVGKQSCKLQTSRPVVKSRPRGNRSNSAAGLCRPQHKKTLEPGRGVRKGPQRKEPGRRV